MIRLFFCVHMCICLVLQVDDLVRTYFRATTILCCSCSITTTDLSLFLGEYPQAVPEFHQSICRCITLSAKLP